MEKGPDEKADTQLSEKRSLTKDINKGTDELAFKKQNVGFDKELINIRYDKPKLHMIS